MKRAFLYAGQGSQPPGMGADLYEAYPEFRAVLDSAEAGFDLKTVSFTDPDGVLNQTEYTQPCMVAFAAGMTAILAGKGIRPDYAAGLSLGEYSALCAAGVFTARQAVELAAVRGPVPGRTPQKVTPAGSGSEARTRADRNNIRNPGPKSTRRSTPRTNRTRPESWSSNIPTV